MYKITNYELAKKGSCLRLIQNKYALYSLSTDICKSSSGKTWVFSKYKILTTSQLPDWTFPWRNPEVTGTSIKYNIESLSRSSNINRTIILGLNRSLQSKRIIWSNAQTFRQLDLEQVLPTYKTRSPLHSTSWRIRAGTTCTVYALSSTIQLRLPLSLPSLESTKQVYKCSLLKGL